MKCGHLHMPIVPDFGDRCFQNEFTTIPYVDFTLDAFIASFEPRFLKHRSLPAYVAPVILTSYGMVEEGHSEIEKYCLDLKHELPSITHRLDLIFTRSEHLSKRGHAPMAQEQLLRQYADIMEEFFQRLFDLILAETERAAKGRDERPAFNRGAMHILACRHGHHRSVAACEIAYKIATKIGLQCHVWHLDSMGRVDENYNCQIHEDRFFWPLWYTLRFKPSYLLHT